GEWDRAIEHARHRDRRAADERRQEADHRRQRAEDGEGQDDAPPQISRRAQAAPPSDDRRADDRRRPRRRRTARERARASAPRAWGRPRSPGLPPTTPSPYRAPPRNSGRGSTPPPPRPVRGS